MIFFFEVCAAKLGIFGLFLYFKLPDTYDFEPTIRHIATLDKSVWEIDVDNYDENNIPTILKIYKDIRLCLINKNNAHLTLITKILLGVFGCVPAFDNYFCNSFRDIFLEECGFSVANEKSLTCINQFYEANRQAIDKLSNETFTMDFMTGQKTTINYPKAKIIDMYGFQLEIEKKNERNTRTRILKS